MNAHCIDHRIKLAAFLKRFHTKVLYNIFLRPNRVPFQCFKHESCSDFWVLVSKWVSISCLSLVQASGFLASSKMANDHKPAVASTPAINIINNWPCKTLANSSYVLIFEKTYFVHAHRILLPPTINVYDLPSGCQVSL